MVSCRSASIPSWLIGFLWENGETVDHSGEMREGYGRSLDEGYGSDGVEVPSSLIWSLRSHGNFHCLHFFLPFFLPFLFLILNVHLSQSFLWMQVTTSAFPLNSPLISRDFWPSLPHFCDTNHLFSEVRRLLNTRSSSTMTSTFTLFWNSIRSKQRNIVNEVIGEQCQKYFASRVQPLSPRVVIGKIQTPFRNPVQGLSAKSKSTWNHQLGIVPSLIIPLPSLPSSTCITYLLLLLIISLTFVVHFEYLLFPPSLPFFFFFVFTSFNSLPPQSSIPSELSRNGPPETTFMCWEKDSRKGRGIWPTSALLLPLIFSLPKEIRKTLSITSSLRK